MYKRKGKSHDFAPVSSDVIAAKQFDETITLPVDFAMYARI
jgi:hypothetical protein